MVKQEPLVSVITPLYNSEKFIEETIKSVLDQTYTNWEMIIIDDCSEDRSVEIVEKYQQKENRIKLLKNKENLGVAESRNEGIKYAKGKYIAFLDSDDLWKKDKLKKQIFFMEENKYNFSYTKFEKIDEKGRRLNIYSKVLTRIQYKDLLYENIIGCLTVIYNKKKLGNLFMKKMLVGEDYTLWLDILKKEKYSYGLSENLAEYRVRKKSLSKNRIKTIKNLYIMYRKYNGQTCINSFKFILSNIYYKYLKNKILRFKENGK